MAFEKCPYKVLRTGESWTSHSPITHESPTSRHDVILQLVTSTTRNATRVSLLFIHVTVSAMLTSVSWPSYGLQVAFSPVGNHAILTTLAASSLADSRTCPSLLSIVPLLDDVTGQHT